MTSLQRSLLVIFALTAFQPLAYSQSPAPAPAPATIKARAQIVIVDVVVTDKNQNPVHNLKQSDFNVIEGSTPQTISHFEEHVYPNPKAPPAEHLPPMPPGVFTNFSPAPPGDSLNIILLDTLNTPMADQSYVRAQLKQYLNTAKPGVRTAIFGLTSRLILLQGFSSNPEILKAVIDKKNPTASPLLDDAAGTGAAEAASDQLSDILGDDPSRRPGHRQHAADGGRYPGLPASAPRRLHARRDEPSCPLPLQLSRPQEPHLVLRLIPAQCLSRH